MEGYLSEVFVSFQGEGAQVGRRHLFVRFGGCNLRCAYCDTPASLERTPRFVVHRSDGTATWHDNPVAPAGLGHIVRLLRVAEAPVDALALTGGEPLQQAGFLAAFLRTAAPGVPVLLETAGVLPGRLAEVIDHVDIVSMDLKLPSATGERPFWEEHAAFLRLARRREVYVKVPVDGRTPAAEVDRAARLVRAVDPDVPVFLQPVMDAQGRPAIGAAELAALYTAARAHLPAVRVLPQVHRILGVR